MCQDDFGSEDVYKEVEEATATWGMIDGLTREKVLTLRECLVAAMETGDVSVAYRDLYGFLAEGCFQLDEAVKAGHEDIDKQLFGSRVLATIHRAMPPIHRSPTVIPAEDEHKLVVFLEALVENFKEMLRVWGDYSQRMADSFGDKITPDAGPAAIWARYAETWDVDSARLCLHEIGRYVAGAIIRGMTGAIIEPLENRVGLLEQVLDELRKASNNGEATS